MLIGGIVIFILIFLDFITKVIAKSLILPSESIVFIPHIIEFRYVTNLGASFGILKNRQDIFMVITVISLLIFGYLFYYSNFKTKKVYSISVSLFIAGTFGNAIDRIFRSDGVIDFIYMPILEKIHSVLGFTYNLADLYLNLAIVLFAVDILFLEGKRKKEVINDENNNWR